MTTQIHPAAILARRILAVASAALTLAVTPLSATSFELVDAQQMEDLSLSVGAGQLVRTDAEFVNVFVADPAVADVQVASSRMLYLTATGIGETTVFILGNDDRVLMSADVRVTHNARALSEALSQVAPGQQVRARSINNSLVVTGRVQTPEQAEDVMRVAGQFAEEERILNRLEIATPVQVNLQVRIAEVSRNIDRQLGIRWNELGISSGISFRGGSGVTNGYGVDVSQSSGGLNLDVMLEALSEEGLVAILAEPNLTARTGEPASFLAGGEFPFQRIEEGETVTDFKDFGIGLAFTPTVIDGNRISLNVAVEVSDIDFSGGADVPALSTRRAQTTVDLASGQSFSIAGLIEDTSSQNVARVPALGSIPIIGALFRSNGFQRGQTELVILVTPMIVQPSRPENLRTPLDDFTPPNDFERILLGRFQGSGEAPVGRSARRLNGAAGFAFE
ncbi:type II and III secretion system protein family protein [Roseovarius tibetensis]|uniref:type II and III secretion system protein family protein n=1 Tax=Roseovarius tibetensis TaxID=2685897 RepID=UPI003D7F5C7B